MRLKYNILQFLTYIAAFLSFLILMTILIFIFINGKQSLNSNLLFNNYWSQNYIAELDFSKNVIQSSSISAMEIDGYYSNKWKIALKDGTNLENDPVLIVTYVANDSMFNYLKLPDFNSKKATNISLQAFNHVLEKIEIESSNHQLITIGRISGDNARETIIKLDQANNIKNIYFKSLGGGIFGSLLTTIYLIILSLVLAFPIGILSAIYLVEYASDNKVTKIIMSGIELLAGVPSIIFGLMGISFFFPVTKFIGATTTSILLGSMTMAVILLPTIIKTIQEALLLVPVSLKEASLSLGSSKAQMIFKIILPYALPGIFTSILLSVGRIIGESAALIYAMGTYISDNPQLLEPATSLSVMIWNIMSNENPNIQLASSISLIILIIVLLLNIIIKLINYNLMKIRG